jgi:hypothetical protein
MAISIVPELIYFYITLGLISLWNLPPARYSRPQTSWVTVTVATSPLPAYYDRTFPLLMGLCRVDPNPSPFLLLGPVLSLPPSILTRLFILLCMCVCNNIFITDQIFARDRFVYLIKPIYNIIFL